MFEGQIFAESVIVALSTAHHFQIYKFQINFFVLYCFVKFLCILLFYFLCISLFFQVFMILEFKFD